MQNIIALHCGIENCNIQYEYKNNEEGIVAIRAQWRNDESKGGDWGGVLPEQPRIGEKYELEIQFALKIDISQNFWATYFEPYTTHEGIESEHGINSMLFCLCQCTKLLEVTRHMARIEIEVIDAKELGWDNNAKAETNKITRLLDRELNSEYISIDNFDNFSMISANYQSDCGWIYIIEKKNGISRIVAENNWDFHQDIWLLTNEELNKEQELRYGIQHRTNLN